MKRCLSTTLLVVLFLYGCNEISSGDKRLKLEYLYKMKAQLTQIMEVSFRMRKHESVTGYKKSISYNIKQVNEAKPVEGWSDGENFKQRFIEVINDDLRLTDSLSKLGPETKFDSNEVILSIRLRQDSLMGSLDSIISKVDKE